jgi:hypothetical protein
LQIPNLLFFLVALYPCAVLVSPLVPFVLGPLNRWMKEDEDPRAAKAWVAIGVTGLGTALALWIAAHAPTSEFAFVSLSGLGLSVDRNGPLGVALVSFSALVASVAMRPQVAGLRPPHGWLLLACGACALTLLADDLRLALAGLELSLGLLALTLMSDVERGASRRAALRWFLWTQPGFLIVAIALLVLVARAHTASLGDIRGCVALETAANVRTARWLVLGFTWLLTVPALPWCLPEVLSRRTLPAKIAVLSTSMALAGWAMMRLVFSSLPYAEAWEHARQGIIVIPGLALLVAGLLTAAARTRAPSPRVSLALAALGPLVPLAFALGRPSFATALALAIATPLLRGALLTCESSDCARPPKDPGPVLARIHTVGSVLSALGLVLTPLVLLPRFVDWRFRLLFGVLLVMPAGFAAYRLTRFSLRERVRRQPLQAWLGAIAAALSLVALLPIGPLHSASGAIEKELGLDMTFGLMRSAQPRPQAPSAPPPDTAVPLPGKQAGTGATR